MGKKDDKDLEKGKGSGAGSGSIFDRLNELQMNDAKSRDREQGNILPSDSLKKLQAERESTKKSAPAPSQSSPSAQNKPAQKDSAKPAKGESPAPKKPEKPKANIFDDARKKEILGLANTLDAYQSRYDKDLKIDKKCDRIIDSEKIDYRPLLLRANEKAVAKMGDAEIVEMTTLLHEALSSAQKAYRARATRLDQTVGVRAKFEIEKKEKKLNRKLSEVEKWDLKNELLLEASDVKGRKSGVLFIVILLLAVALLIGLGIGIWYYYVSTLSEPLTGKVSVTMDFDRDTWYEYDIDESSYKNRKINPGDTINPNIVLRNSAQIEGGISSEGDPLMLRFRASVKMDGVTLNGAIHVVPKVPEDDTNNLSSTHYWIKYDADKEAELNSPVTIDDGWFYYSNYLGYGEAISLIDSITFDGEMFTEEFAGKTLEVVVEVQAVSRAHRDLILERRGFDVDDEGQAVLTEGETSDLDPNTYWVFAPEEWRRVILTLS